MSWMDSIKDVLFEENATTKASTPPSATTPSATTPATPVNANSTVPAVNTEMVETIKKVAFSRKTAYTALLEAANKLEAVIPDSATRMKAAYAMVGDQRSLTSIVSAIDVHINDVRTELDRFKKQITSCHDTEVLSLQKEADELNTANNRIQEQIATLTQTMTDNTARRTDITERASARDAELKKSLSDFEVAVNQIQAMLDEQRTSITQNLS